MNCISCTQKIMFVVVHNNIQSDQGQEFSNNVQFELTVDKINVLIGFGNQVIYSRVLLDNHGCDYSKLT